MKVVQEQRKKLYLKGVLVMNRLKSKVVWLSVLSLVIILMSIFGVFEKIGITEGNFKILIETILSILVLLGILNNPTDKDNF